MRSLCFPIMPLYSGLVKILLLTFYVAQSLTLSVVSVLNRLSVLHIIATGVVCASWWAVRALRSDSPLPTTECRQATTSFGSSSSWDGTVQSAATFPATVSSRFKLALKERAATNEIKCEPTLTATGKPFPGESYATANVSLLAP